jgi:hypothetical protein
MLNKKLSILIRRAKKLKLAPKLDLEEILLVEQALNIIFPDDFKEISSEYNYEYISAFEMYNFSLSDEYSVKGGTIKWRNSISLPSDYLVLGENGSSAIIMKIENNNSTIIWCALEDVFNLCDGKPMEYNPTIFPSFTDFFEFLIDEEEKMQAEDRALEEQASKE